MYKKLQIPKISKHMYKKPQKYKKYLRICIKQTTKIQQKKTKHMYKKQKKSTKNIKAYV